MLRVPPGSKDLKEATPIQMSDLQPGDRVLVRPKQGQDPTAFVAATIVAMKKDGHFRKAAEGPRGMAATWDWRPGQQCGYSPEFDHD